MSIIAILLCYVYDVIECSGFFNITLVLAKNKKLISPKHSESIPKF